MLPPALCQLRDSATSNSVSETSRATRVAAKISGEQEAIVTHFTTGKENPGGMVVVAGAGTGKTTTLVHLCEAWTRARPGRSFLAVSFTDKSTRELRARLQSRIADPSAMGDDHWVLTIHGFCQRLATEYPDESGLGPQQRVLSAPEARDLWNQARDRFWSRRFTSTEREAVDHLLETDSVSGIHGLATRLLDLRGTRALEALEVGTVSERALATVFRGTARIYENLKRRRTSADFSDLELAADRALEHARVREDCIRRFGLVLVDEFQDTNPLQARILWRVTRADQSNLLVVGDPKQSIYGFRDADLDVFFELTKKLPHRRVLSLNFRSRPAVVAAVNQICEPLFTKTTGAYDPLTAVREHVPDSSVSWVESDTPAGIADLVRGWLAQGQSLSDTVLLLRKVRGSAPWIEALRSSGVRVAIESGGFFWSDPRVRELVALLRFWWDPRHDLSAAVFFRAPWVAVPDATLDQWFQSRRSTMTDLKATFLASGHRLVPVLQALEGQGLLVSEFLMGLLEGGKGAQGADSSEIERELGLQLMNLWLKVRALEDRGLGPLAVIGDLSLAIEEDRKEGDVPPPRGERTLRVMTIHGSKGLEFDRVILADFTGRFPHDPTPRLLWDRKLGCVLAERDSEGTRTDDTRFEAFKLDLRKKRLEEDMRLFYVALTRARENLVFFRVREEEKQKPVADPLAERDWRAWVETLVPDLAIALAQPVPSRQTIQAIQAKQAKQAEPDTQAVSREQRSLESPELPVYRPRVSVSEWLLLDLCPLQYRWSVVERRFSFRNELVRDDDRDANEEAKVRGTLVHEVLEKGLWSLLDHVSIPTPIQNAFRDWALSTPLLQGAGEGDANFAELGFDIPLAGTPTRLVGSMDRVNIRAGKAVILDYKIAVSSHAEPVPAEPVRTKPPQGEVRAAPGVRAEAGDRYDLQLRLYALALAKLDPALGSNAISGTIVRLTLHDRFQAREQHYGPWTHEDFARTENRLVGAMNKVQTAVAKEERTVGHPGRHCLECPWVSECPDAQHLNNTEILTI